MRPWPCRASPSPTVSVPVAHRRRPRRTAPAPIPVPPATLIGKEAVSIKEIPSSVSVITRQVMDDWNMVTLYDTLSQATGVTAIPNDGTQAQYNSRGYGMNAMYDGIPS